MMIQVLLSTMHQTNYSLLEKMNIQSDVVVVNQCDRHSEERFIFNGYSVIWINSKDRGISRSRNMAISNATGDVCLIADDDEELIDGYSIIAKEAFENNPMAHIIQFQVNGVEGEFKNYPAKPSGIGYLRSMRASSVEIAFRRNYIMQYGISFDELIGAGTELSSGEENAFLFSCLSHRLKVFYYPHVIAKLHLSTSTWFNGYNKDYFIAKGAGFAAMAKGAADLLILQFALRHLSLYKKEMTISKAMKYMKKGKEKYLKLKFPESQR